MCFLPRSPCEHLNSQGLYQIQIATALLNARTQWVVVLQANNIIEEHVCYSYLCNQNNPAEKNNHRRKASCKTTEKYHPPPKN